MRIALLARPQGWHSQDLQRAAGDRHQINFIAFSDLQALVGQPDHVGAGSGPDLVIVRTMPPGSLEQVIFRMDVLARWQASGLPVINPPKALEASIDKYLTLSLIQAAGIPVPETFVCQRVDQAMAGFEQLDGDVVIKPIFGGEGRGITRLTDPDLAYRAFKLMVANGAVIYMQRFIAHENQDFRMLVIGREVFAMRRHNPDDWRTNASRGAECFAWQPGEGQIELALQAARAVGADIAGVDLISGPDGREMVLEVNAVPGWRALSQALNVDIADKVIRYAAQKLAGQDSKKNASCQSTARV